MARAARQLAHADDGALLLRVDREVYDDGAVLARDKLDALLGHG